MEFTNRYFDFNHPVSTLKWSQHPWLQPFFPI
jgi:hypothetical protein